MGEQMNLYIAHEPPWAARYNPWLLIELMPKAVVFSFLFSFLAHEPVHVYTTEEVGNKMCLGAYDEWQDISKLLCYCQAAELSLAADAPACSCILLEALQVN